MAQLYRVGNPIDREERANLNLTLDDIQSRFSLLQSQVNFLAGGADTEALIQEINQAIEDANNATENVDNALILVDDKLQELELELAKANELKPVGAWNSSTAYKQNNIVTKDGTSYIALVDNTNVDVTDTNTWQVSAAKGDKGDTGKGLTIVGTLTDPSQLPATGSEGDAYYVGTDLYVWMVDHWENIGQIKGDPGSDADVTAANIESALGYTPASELTFEQFGTQYEFREPTIIGRQLRITKTSDSDRLPLVLYDDIADGAAITVSLNNGSTSIALKNVDGTNVTKLEKGFIEIVQTGSFFTLRNKGGLNQSDLDALITLTNEADVNDSTLRTEFVDTVNSLDVLTPLNSNSSWNEILLKLPEIKSSKKSFVSGTATSTGSTSTFTTYDNSNTINRARLNVSFSDIGFVPSRITLFNVGGGNANYSTEFFKNLGSLNNYVELYRISTNNNTSNTHIGIKLDTVAYVNETGFSLPVQSSNTVYDWSAYE